MSTLKLQSFVDALTDALDFETMTLTAPVSAVVPSDVEDRRAQIRQAKTLAEYVSLTRFQGYVVPAGTVIEMSAGRSGDQLAGGAAFYTVDAKDAIATVFGDSKEIRAAFDAWVSQATPLS